MIKEPPITLVRQIGVYALSIFLPPLGLWPGLKYLMQNDPKAKTVGFIAIVLTLLSTVITISLTMSFIHGILGSNTGSSNQLQQLQNYGY